MSSSKATEEEQHIDNKQDARKARDKHQLKYGTAIPLLQLKLQII